MKKAVFLTTYNRLRYLQHVLSSWENVRGQEDWDFVAMIEPSEISKQVVEEFEEFQHKTNFRSFSIHVNPQIYGVLHHPWVGFENLFSNRDIGGNYDFVVRAEDDLVVSDDILEYFTWTAAQYESDPKVATIHAFTHHDGELTAVNKTEAFSPWLWGTWRDRWNNLLGPTWDHDYSTNNGVPGVEAGWDWNLNTRIFVKHDLLAITPMRSRADNIGMYGTHAQPQDFVQSGHFESHHPPVDYHEGR